MKKIILVLAVTASIFGFTSCTELEDSLENENVEVQATTGENEDDYVEPGKD
ncbi:hypothetical protein [uncultured Polaribacter sp.]|uniref:hypothetical protein n=1 Tax=uncultured Polaribacter sp. TaxID=174711 RepID=UPI00262C8657|nr:hypothetical protein [uncultured Polaribacter sp.]